MVAVRKFQYTWLRVIYTLHKLFFQANKKMVCNLNENG